MRVLTNLLHHIASSIIRLQVFKQLADLDTSCDFTCWRILMLSFSLSKTLRWMQKSGV